MYDDSKDLQFLYRGSGEGGGGLAAGMGMRSFALRSFAQNCSFKEPFTHVTLYKRVMRAHQSLKRAT